jgi:hypothetical protein
MNRKITEKSVVKVVGWATIVATIILILMRVVFNLQPPMIAILLGFSSGSFCLYLGYIHKGSKK